MAWRNPWYNDKEPEVDLSEKMQYDTLKEKGFHYNEDEDQSTCKRICKEVLVYG